MALLEPPPIPARLPSNSGATVTALPTPAVHASDEPQDDDGRHVALVSASSVVARPTEWLWAGRIPLGDVAIIAGQEGIGKTTLVAELLARVTRGQLEGDFYGQPASVVYATAEDSRERTLKPRFAAAGADLDRVFFVNVNSLPGGLVVPSDLAALVEQMRQVGAKVLVLDPLGAHLSATLDTHKDASVRQALAPLAAYMDRAKASAIGIMHWNKGASSVALDRINGSRAFTAAARTVIAVANNPDDDGTKFVLLVKANLGRLDQPALRYRIEGRSVPLDGQTLDTSGIAWCGEAAGVSAADLFGQPATEEERSERARAKEWVREYLQAGSRPALRDEDYRRLQREEELSKSTLRRAMNQLGVIKRKAGFGGGWEWELPAEGAQPVQREHLEHLGHLRADQQLCGSEDAQIPEDAQPLDVSTFGTFDATEAAEEPAVPPVASVSDAPSLHYLPLGEVRSCRICRRTTTTADSTGAICRQCVAEVVTPPTPAPNRHLVRLVTQEPCRKCRQATPTGDEDGPLCRPCLDRMNEKVS